MSENVQQPPSEWGKIKLNECATLITKGTTPTTHGYEYRNEGIRFVRVEHFSNGVIDTTLINQFISQHAHDFLKRSQLCEGDVLVSIAGTIGRVAIVRNFDTPANTNQAVGIIRGVEQVFYPPFLGSLLASPYVQKSIRNRKRGGGMNNISLEDLRDISVPVPPFVEQLRIAEALDELFSDLDAAVAALERVRAKLKLYRASVLKAAVEGALTAEWREQHRHTEPASELLKRILVERRRRLEEEQLSKFKEKGKDPPKDWKTKYKEPVAIDAGKLPALSDGWLWSSGDALFGFITSGSRGWSRFCGDQGSLFIRMANLDHGSTRLDLAQKQLVRPPAGSEGLRTRVKPRDILISITADVGMIALAPDDIKEAYINQHIALARPVLPDLGAFVAWYLASPSGGQQALRDLQRGATKVGLGLDDIRNVAIPLPPLAEQEAIVEAVEDQLSVIDHLEADLDTKLQSAQALRQSILRHAFTGQLVPQDPNDEPASELLKRIAAEREVRARKAAAAKQATRKSKTSRSRVSDLECGDLSPLSSKPTRRRRIERESVGEVPRRKSGDRSPHSKKDSAKSPHSTKRA